MFRTSFIDPETGEDVSILHKWIFHSKVFWLNVGGVVVEILTNQTLLVLPFYTEFVKVHPNTGLYIAAAVSILNMVLRLGGGAPLSFRRNGNG